PNVDENLPSLEHFELQENGAIEVRKLSTLEKTLAYLMGTRREKTQALKVIKGRVLRSVDIIKIALMRLQAGSQIDENLEKRLQSLIQSYNSIMGKAKKEPKSLADKLKYFFLKSCGFALDEEVKQHEIQLPKENYYDSDQPQGSLLSHKITRRTIESTSQKITSCIQAGPPPCALQKQEVDLFRMKAVSLLHIQEA